MAAALAAIGGLIVLLLIGLGFYGRGRQAGGDEVKAAENAAAADAMARMAEAAASQPVTRKDRAQRARESGL